MEDLRAQLDEAECGLERLEPGSVVPAGECPKCGAFAYIDDGEQRLRDAAQDLLDALRDAEFLLRKAGQKSGPMRDSFNRSASDARSAIAKATGKAQP